MISQIYAGGGESGATLKNDFIELFNRGTTTVDVTGWSVQYASAGGLDWQKTELSGAIAPGQYYLVQEAAGSDGSVNLPTPDASGNIPMSSLGGRVALASDNTLLTSVVNCPGSLRIVDVVGYGGNAVCYEGPTPAPALNNATALLRSGNGCGDTDRNAADFAVGVPTPRNTATTLNPCAGATADRADVMTVLSGPASVDAGGRVNYSLNTTNVGPAAASRVVITCLLPAGLTSISVSNGGVLNGRTVVWPTVAGLAAGARLSFTVSGNAPTVVGVLTATARSASDTFDPNTSNNRSAVSTAVLAGARLGPQDVLVTATGPLSCIGQGSLLTITVVLTNGGRTAQANNTGPEYLASLPLELSAAGCSATSGRCSVPRGRRFIQWDGAINAGQSVTITYFVIVTANAQLGVPFCILSTVSFDSDNDGVNDASTGVSTCAATSCGTEEVPGDPWPDASAASDQKAGSVLVYNLYASSATTPEIENTRLNITNTSEYEMVYVHLFFVDGSSCSVADAYICLTPSQTTCLLASDLDPGTVGYVVAVAVDGNTGCPVYFNNLIGDEYVKLASGHRANLGAVAFSALTDPPSICDDTVTEAVIALDGVQYNCAPRALALDNFLSPNDGNSTLLVLNGVGGDLRLNADEIGTVFGFLFDDQEAAYSLMFPAGCQLRREISDNFPRTTPRVRTIVPAGHSGWMRFWRVTDGGLLGAVLNFNPQAGVNAAAFSHGRNFHYLTLTDTAAFTIPVFPPTC